MVVTYKGVIAGIGSKQDDINVIEPKFDAQLRNLLVGKSGIITGFEFKDNNLSAGVCIHDGFLGSYDSDITDITATQKEEITESGAYHCTYGEPVKSPFPGTPIVDQNVSNTSNVNSIVGDHKFVFDHTVLSCTVTFISSRGSLNAENYISMAISGNTVEITVFRLPMSADGIIIRLNVTQLVGIEEINVPAKYIYGKFTVNHDRGKLDSFEIVPTNSLTWGSGSGADILNEAGEYYLLLSAAERLKYPEKAKYSDYTTVVQADGELEDGVTAVTQEVNDNSDKVATTEYVYNQIVEQIGYKSTKINISNSFGKLIEIILEKKANYVLVFSSFIGFQSVDNYNVFSDADFSNFTEITVPQEFASSIEQNEIISIPYFLFGQGGTGGSAIWRSGVFICHFNGKKFIKENYAQVKTSQYPIDDSRTTTVIDFAKQSFSGCYKTN